MPFHFLVDAFLWLSSALTFIGNLVDNFFEPFFDVAPHGRYVDLMLDFILNNSLSKSLRSIDRLFNDS
jgi:hypothetical protein